MHVYKDLHKSYHTFDFRDFRQKDIAKFHVQLAMSMMFMLIVFVAGIDRTENRSGCITVGVLLHWWPGCGWLQKLSYSFRNL